MVVKEVAQLIREGAEKMMADFVFCFVFAKDVEQLTSEGAREGISRRWLGWCWVTLAIAGCCVLGQLYRRVSDMWGCCYSVMITGWIRYQLKNKRHSDFSWRWAVWKNYCQQKARSNHDNGILWWDRGQIRRGPDPPLSANCYLSKKQFMFLWRHPFGSCSPFNSILIFKSCNDHICFLNPSFVSVVVKF